LDCAWSNNACGERQNTHLKTDKDRDCHKGFTYSAHCNITGGNGPLRCKWHSQELGCVNEDNDIFN
jgi:hypothetical protein